MAKKIYENIRIQNRMDTESNWTTANSVILPGERVISIQSDGSVRAKVNTTASEANYNTLQFEDKYIVDNVDAMTEALSNIQGTVGTLQTQVGSFDGRIRATEEKNTQQDSAIQGMQTDVDAMTESVGTMQSTVSTLQGQVSGYSGAISNLQSQMAGLAPKVTALESDMAGKAPLASPAFSGAPTAPTPASSSNDTTVATTAFVKTAMAGASGGTKVVLSASTPADMKTGDIWLKQL